MCFVIQAAGGVVKKLLKVIPCDSEVCYTLLNCATYVYHDIVVVVYVCKSWPLDT